MTVPYVVMGISRRGKCRSGAKFATAVGARFIDGDSLHPQANIDNMSHGKQLTDADCAPLPALEGQAVEPHSVKTYSISRHRSRNRSRKEGGVPLEILCLHVPRDVMNRRLKDRPGHHMPASQLDSQFAEFEPPDPDELQPAATIRTNPQRIARNLVLATKVLST